MNCFSCHKRKPKVLVSWGVGGSVFIHNKCLSGFMDRNPMISKHNLLTLQSGYRSKKFKYPPQRVGMGKYSFKVGCKCGNEEITDNKKGSLKNWDCSKSKI